MSPLASSRFSHCAIRLVVLLRGAKSPWVVRIELWRCSDAMWLYGVSTATSVSFWEGDTGSRRSCEAVSVVSVVSAVSAVTVVSVVTVGRGERRDAPTYPQAAKTVLSLSCLLFRIDCQNHVAGKVHSEQGCRRDTRAGWGMHFVCGLLS